MIREYSKQEIVLLIETIAEQAETIFANEKKIPQIELDIILNNVRNLYEELTALNKSNNKLDGGQSASLPKEVIVNKISVSDLITATIVDANPPKPQVQQVVSNPAPAEVKTAEPAISENIEEKIEIVAANKVVENPVAPPQVIVEEKIVAANPQAEEKPIAPPQVVNQQPSQKENIEEKIEIVAANNVVAEPIISIPVNKPTEQSKAPSAAEPQTNLQEEIVAKAVATGIKYESRKPNKTAASLFDAAPSLGAQFDDARTLKEKISSTKTEKSIADKIHHQKIDDLKKAIGINEKFLFINELFEGSLASYNEHIEKINTSSSVDHARSIVDSLITKYNWDSEQEIVKKMMDLVERRFS